MDRRTLLALAGASGVNLTLGASKALAQSRGTAQAFALFQGVNSVTGAAHGTAVTGMYESAGSTTTVFHAEVCNTTDTFKKAIDLNISGGVSFAGVGGISAKAHWFNSLEVTSHSTSIVCRVQHIQGANTYTNVGLLDTAKKLNLNDPAAQSQFARAFGDSFVSSVTTGGEYLAVYIFEAESREEKEQFEASLKLNGVYKALSADLEIKKTINQVVTSTKMRTVFDQLVTGFSSPPKLPTADDVVQFGLDFPARTLTAPTVTSFSTIGYETLPEFAVDSQNSNAFGAVTTARAYFLGGLADAGAVDKMQRINAHRIAAQNISRSYQRYGYSGDAALNSRISVLSDDYRKLAAQVDQFSSNPAQFFRAPDLPSLDYGTPSIHVDTPESPKFGGISQNTTATDGLPSPELFIENGMRISSIRICYDQGVTPGSFGGAILALDVGYEDKSGHQSNLRFGFQAADEDKEAFLKWRPIWTDQLNLGRGQLITEITCQHLPGLDVMALTIKSGSRSIGTPYEVIPPGIGGYMKDIKTETWSPPSGALLAGFRTRQNDLGIREIVAVACSLQPAFWDPDQDQ